MLLRVASLAAASVCLCAAVHPEAGKVLVLVNDVAPPEPGTDGKGVSVFVGEHYAQQRGVPAGQILHLNIPLGGCANDPPIGTAGTWAARNSTPPSGSRSRSSWRTTSSPIRSTISCRCTAYQRC